MKNSILKAAMLLLITVSINSCSKENDPVDDNLFVGTYEGSVSYSQNMDNTNISTEAGRVTLIKVGDSYNFDFSDGIPNLNGIKMEKNQNTFVSIDGAISIDEGNLVIAYSKGEETWGANCTR